METNPSTGRTAQVGQTFVGPRGTRHRITLVANGWVHTPCSGGISQRVFEAGPYAYTRQCRVCFPDQQPAEHTAGRLMALLADDATAIEFAAKTLAEKENPGVWDRAPEFRTHWREVAGRFRPVLAALRSAAMLDEAKEQADGQPG